jgi:hypothetical protein
VRHPNWGEWSRRAFLTRSAVLAGAVSAGLAGCSSGDDAPRGSGNGKSQDPDGEEPVTFVGGEIAAADIPAQATIFGWVAQVFEQGIRRPGYPADEWAEGFVVDQFREIGLESVRREPITVLRWEPHAWSLEVSVAGGDTRELECFPVPNAAPVDDLAVELAAYDAADPAVVAGKASLYDVTLLRIPADTLVTSGSAPADPSGRTVDPEGILASTEHVVPFGPEFQEVMEASIEAGAVAFVGTLTDYPGDSFNYFVPYDGIERPIPGVWISGSDGAWLREQLGRGPVRARLTVESESVEVESHNIVGELPGVDDDTVMIGSHHDGPWASAVEDGSGIALVLAQATYWAAQPVERRPHRLVFLLQGGHMSGGAGLRGYIEQHREEIADVVLEVHLEHAALAFAETDAATHELAPTGLPVPRWFFTTRIPPLEAAVIDALEAESLSHSMLLAPDAFGEQPPTDGADYHREGVPVMNFLTAPFYLFDKMDTLDKIDREHLVPLTRATVRIIDWTGGWSAADLRAAVTQ